MPSSEVSSIEYRQIKEHCALLLRAGGHRLRQLMSCKPFACRVEGGLSALAREPLPDTMLVSLSANPQPISAVSGNCCVSTGKAHATSTPSG